MFLSNALVRLSSSLGTALGYRVLVRRREERPPWSEGVPRMDALIRFDPILSGAVRRRDIGAVLFRVLVYLLLLGGGVLFMLPALWMLSTAFKPLADAVAFPPVWIPKTIQLNNFTDPFKDLPFARFYRNTLIITAAGIVGVLLSCTPVAFAFARLNFRGRDALFVLVLEIGR